VLHLYTTIERLEDGEPIEIEVRVLFSFDQTPYELELQFEGACVEDQYCSGPKLTLAELGRIETWFYTKGYDHALEIAREEIASNYQTD